jgi:hypothetical protein
MLGAMMARKRMGSVRSARPRLRINTGGCFAGVSRDWLWPRLGGIAGGLALLTAYGLAGREDMRVARDQVELAREVKLVLAQEETVNRFRMALQAGTVED